MSALSFSSMRLTCSRTGFASSLSIRSHRAGLPWQPRTKGRTRKCKGRLIARRNNTVDIYPRQAGQFVTTIRAGEGAPTPFDPARVSDLLSPPRGYIRQDLPRDISKGQPRFGFVILHVQHLQCPEESTGSAPWASKDLHLLSARRR